MRLLIQNCFYGFLIVPIITALLYVMRYWRPVFTFTSDTKEDNTKTIRFVIPQSVHISLSNNFI
jgi:hypothetical protein